MYSTGTKSSLISTSKKGAKRDLEATRENGEKQNIPPILIPPRTTFLIAELPQKVKLLKSYAYQAHSA